MLFKVANNATGRSTHCGVLEFIAQEGHVYLPRWVRASTARASSRARGRQLLQAPGRRWAAPGPRPGRSALC